MRPVSGLDLGTNKISRSESILLYCLFASIGLLSYVPSLTEPQTLIYIFFFFLFLLQGVLRAKNEFYINRTGLNICWFIAYLSCAGVPLALLHEVEFAAALRALIPFLFLLSYLYFYNLSVRDESIVPKLILTSAIVWMIKVLILNATDIIWFFLGSLDRLTHVSTDLLVPFGLIGFCVSLYSNQMNKAARIALTLSFFTLIVASGYRSQLLISIGVFLIYIKAWRSRSGILAGVMLLAVFMFLVIYTDIFDVIIQRMHGTGGDTTRAREWSYAWNKFLQSPVWGTGLGTPVSVDYTRSGVYTTVVTDYVPYVHNIVAYFLMNTGLIGLIGIFLIFLRPLKRITKLVFFNLPMREERILVLLFALFLFFMISASFRQIQTMMIFSAALSLVTLPRNSHNAY